MTAPHPPVTLREGDTIAGKYVVERILGAGGMGIVLAAQHTVLGSRVAIKVLLPAASAIPGATERFVREARAAAALHGEHVARVVDVGTLDDGMPFLVMEYLTGKDLREVLRARGPLPIEEVAEYMVQVCDAIAEAHGLGIVHRDLKPGNLFLTQRPNGTPLVKVLDFGLAKVLDGASKAVQDASLTVTGLVIGSPPYMPPEQLRSLKLADARSDLWSLGVIMHELLTGRQPFAGDGMEGLLVAIVADEPMPPRSLRPEIPEAIDALVRRCLRKNPNERVQTAQEMAEVLSPFATPRRPAFGSLGSIVAENSGVGPAVGSMGRSSVNPASTANPSSASAGAAPAITSPRNPAGKAAPTMPMEPTPATPTHAPSVQATPRLDAPIQPGKPGGDATTLTLSSSEIGARDAAARRPKTLAWVIGGVSAATIVVIVALAFGLQASAQGQTATNAESAGAGADANGSAIPGGTKASGVDTAASSTTNAPAVTPAAPASAPSTAVPSAKPSSTVPNAGSTGNSKSTPAGASTAKKKEDLLKPW